MLLLDCQDIGPNQLSMLVLRCLGTSGSLRGKLVQVMLHHLDGIQSRRTFLLQPCYKGQEASNVADRLDGRSSDRQSRPSHEHQSEFIGQDVSYAQQSGYPT